MKLEKLFSHIRHNLRQSIKFTNEVESLITNPFLPSSQQNGTFMSTMVWRTPGCSNLCLDIKYNHSQHVKREVNYLRSQSPSHVKDEKKCYMKLTNWDEEFSSACILCFSLPQFLTLKWKQQCEK